MMKSGDIFHTHRWLAKTFASVNGQKTRSNQAAQA